MKKVECPYCEGDGQVVDYADDVLGNTIPFSTNCDCCEGEGEIPENEMELAKQLYPKTNRQFIKEIEGK